MSITSAKKVSETLRDIRRGYNKKQAEKGGIIFDNNKKSIEQEFEKQLKEALKKSEDEDVYFYFPFKPTISAVTEDFGVRAALGRKIVEYIEKHDYTITLHPNITCPDYLEFGVNVN